MHAKDGNLFVDIPERSHDEIITNLLTLPHLTIERIVSTGQATKEGEWLDQARTEWVVLLSGSAGVLFEGEDAPREMKPGDYVTIPPHKRHRIGWTAKDKPTVWLAVHVADV